jgi:hypothetical protein
MILKRLILSLLAAVLSSGLRALDNPTPFDPKPLMDKVAQRVRTDKYRFAVLGDVKHASNFPALLRVIEEDIVPDFCLTTGDMVQSGGGKVGPGYWEKLSLDNGDTFRKRPWWPAIGNHEIGGSPIITRAELDDDDDILAKNQDSGIENFKKFYNLERDYYSFSFRNAVFIALPFKYPKGESEKWLEAELKKAKQDGKLIFVFNHCPFYTIGNKSKREVPNEKTPITDLFEKYGVVGVFSGHDHGYYRTVRGGIPYVISAGGGARIYPAMRLDEALPEDVIYFGEPNTAFGDPLPEGTKVVELKPMEYKPAPSSLADKAKEEARKAAEKARNNDKKTATATTSARKQYFLWRNGAAGKPDRITDQPDLFTVVVDVDGNKVTMYCITARGEKLDEMILK